MSKYTLKRHQCISHTAVRVLLPTYPSNVFLQRETTSSVASTSSTLILTGSVKLAEPRNRLLWLRMLRHVSKPQPCLRWWRCVSSCSLSHSSLDRANQKLHAITLFVFVIYFCSVAKEKGNSLTGSNWDNETSSDFSSVWIITFLY